MLTTAAALAQSAHEIMAAHPSSSGWDRHESRRCAGQHEKLPVANDSLILWRRRREFFAEPSMKLLDPVDDPPLYVAERVGPALCVTDRWVYINRTVLDCDIIRRDLGTPWSFSDGEFGPGMTIKLTTENGEWVWVVTGKPSPCCGGYTAKWAD
ncbi:hypothetical protein ORI20_13860 [Mycobacterium sp. CVI_P3]|uniref:Secreted protein n=1 Tax=Mycobacterium pinniadriaticum TaxID=2994102 RepID=A0ABT3SE44_9MYCO|nr:hypothetical protein [Mycobacterium pinniadriaticum]MCX2931365.1 hypothetical protein [Mycobacterium pinniadriaticum]MCX2937789.1 hypothetical protein [Mycobacterium pinniadriaticum]